MSKKINNNNLPAETNQSVFIQIKNWISYKFIQNESIKNIAKLKEKLAETYKNATQNTTKKTSQIAADRLAEIIAKNRQNYSEVSKNN